MCKECILKKNERYYGDAGIKPNHQGARIVKFNKALLLSIPFVGVFLQAFFLYVDFFLTENGGPSKSNL